MGSYTASGDGDAEDEGNLSNIRLAHKHDMGVFIISPYDKGGRVFAPSNLCRELMLPEMEPMEYGESPNRCCLCQLLSIPLGNSNTLNVLNGCNQTPSYLLNVPDYRILVALVS